jgi:hypothetical protein
LQKYLNLIYEYQKKSRLIISWEVQKNEKAFPAYFVFGSYFASTPQCRSGTEGTGGNGGLNRRSHRRDLVGKGCP